MLVAIAIGYGITKLGRVAAPDGALDLPALLVAVGAACVLAFTFAAAGPRAHDG